MLLALRDRSAPKPMASCAWIIGCGWFVGAFVLTIWIRVLSRLGIVFSLATIGVPLLIVTVVLMTMTLRQHPTGWSVRQAWKEFSGLELESWRRALWLALLVWLAVRLFLLLLEVMTIPLYPWDAWTQSATKARVWFELGRIVPFERADGWFSAAGAAYFDAAPNYPATVPLWQVWTDLALGRWDDSLMNLPWWLLSVAFLFAVYSTLRRVGYSAIGALVGTWLVSSLPLANVHVALAGYADLPMAAYYALAGIAVWNWTRERNVVNAVLALVLVAACPTIKTPGIVWALTLVPAVVLTLFPQYGKKILGAALVIAIVAVVVLARTQAVLLGYQLHLEFAPPWLGMFESMFLLGNWHLLWYGALAIAIVGWREATGSKLLPLSVTIASGLLFLFVVFAFTNARAWVTDQTTVNRATLHLAPLLSLWGLIVFQTWLQRLRSAAATPVAASA